jgi:hypothetical protein
MAPSRPPPGDILSFQASAADVRQSAYPCIHLEAHLGPFHSMLPKGLGMSMQLLMFLKLYCCPKNGGTVRVYNYPISTEVSREVSFATHEAQSCAHTRNHSGVL